MKKKLFSVLLIGLLCMFTGCKEVQIFEKEDVLVKENVSENKLEQDTYYVKEGTKFTKVYLPETNARGVIKKLDSSRIMYFNDDEFMVPEHYKGELIAYASASADLEYMVLERYEDIGYSLGIYGGTIKEDGYYHFSVKNNTIEGSQAQSYFNNTESDEIRLISVGGTPIAEVIDPGSGIIRKLKKDTAYTLEFYAGTYYYRANFTADTHFLRAFEVYNYDSKYISDTTHGYMCFSTPETLKSGYYNVNGSGLMLYHSYNKGEIVENENINESYYANRADIIASYSQQYSINVPQATKDMVIQVPFGQIKDGFDQNTEISAYLVSPDGTGYDLEVNQSKRKMTITLAYAQAGEWTLNICPKSLEIGEIMVTSDEVYEETTCFEQEFEVTEDTEYQMFYAEIMGSTDENVHGSIIGSNGQTYIFTIEKYKDEDGNYRRRMYCKVPYLKKDTYKVKIYYYKSTNSIVNLQLTTYDKTVTDIYEFN